MTPAEEFTNEFINSIRDGKGDSFRKRYREMDILLVDDIQFLADKESTQEEFFHTFNTLHNANMQIVLSSDQPPKQLTATLEVLEFIASRISLVTERLIVMLLCGKLSDLSLPQIEAQFGGRDHPTVMHADRKIRAMAERRSIYNQVTDLTNRVKNKAQDRCVHCHASRVGQRGHPRQ